MGGWTLRIERGSYLRSLDLASRPDSSHPRTHLPLALELSTTFYQKHLTLIQWLGAHEDHTKQKMSPPTFRSLRDYHYVVVVLHLL